MRNIMNAKDTYAYTSHGLCADKQLTMEHRMQTKSHCVCNIVFNESVEQTRELG